MKHWWCLYNWWHLGLEIHTSIIWVSCTYTQILYHSVSCFVPSYHHIIHKHTRVDRPPSIEIVKFVTQTETYSLIPLIPTNRRLQFFLSTFLRLLVELPRSLRRPALQFENCGPFFQLKNHGSKTGIQLIVHFKTF